MCANPLTGLKIKRLQRLRSLFDRDHAVPTGTFFQWPAIFSDFSYALSQSQHDLTRNAKLRLRSDLRVYIRLLARIQRTPYRPSRMNRIIAILASAMLLILVVTVDDSPARAAP